MDRPLVKCPFCGRHLFTMLALAFHRERMHSLPNSLIRPAATFPGVDIDAAHRAPRFRVVFGDKA